MHLFTYRTKTFNGVSTDFIYMSPLISFSTCSALHQTYEEQIILNIFSQFLSKSNLVLNITQTTIQPNFPFTAVAAQTLSDISFIASSVVWTVNSCKR